MEKRLTELTEEERDECKRQVRALAAESPTLLMVEVVLDRPNEVKVHTEWSKETGKWRLIRAQERYKAGGFCGVELSAVLSNISKNIAKLPPMKDLPE